MVKNVVARAALLEAVDITFGYAREPLLYDVCMQINTGEMVGLLGPNGSGKTTLLRLLSGVMTPQQGKVLLEGRDLRRWGRRGVAQRIAVVPQELHMPFAFTVEQMVSLGRTPYLGFFQTQGRRDRALVQEAMEGAGVSLFADKVFNELSGGERQRVMVAMAMAQQPKILLLDEPTAHLDIKYQIETLELVRRLNREREVTVIAALHDLNLAARYFPRLLLFQRGVVADAAPAEVLEPGLLRRVYGVNVQVGIMRGSEHISVLPPGSVEEAEKQPEDLASAQAQVLLMAGGGSGELMMRGLADVHVPFIAGVLNIGDSDLILALRLASEVITEQPYAPISADALGQLRTRLAQVKTLIVCPMPVGPGNLVLLQEALAAVQQGLVVILLTPQGWAEGGGVDQSRPGMLHTLGVEARDYTDGEGVRLIEQLVQQGAVVVGSVGEAVESLRQYAILASMDKS